MSRIGRIRPNVRNPFSEGAVMPGKSPSDRRVARTEAALRDALGALVREKPYPEIVVKEILARADVGRSTFYAHFDDKDDLLLSCIHEMLGVATDGAARRAEGPLWFSLPILTHIEAHWIAEGAGARLEGHETIHEHLRAAIMELVDAGIEPAIRRRAPAEQVTLVTRWVATTFILVLEWWGGSAAPVPAREADRIFRRLVTPALAATLA